MKYLFKTAMCLLFCVWQASAQDFAVKGSVSDTLLNNQLYRASVVAIRNNDSVIAAFARTDPSGNFILHLSRNGKYILRTTFPGFADHVEVIDVKNAVTDLGMVPMVSKEHLLQTFVFTQQIAAIKIKGDTTEYMADSFKVKDNATVEDLLKRLPGIQVDKDGKITAQGETVQKILVDGEEFFSDDPKVVTQGLQANAVNKVQVYDKKSDQAEFTGIDDGQKTKTINLELKDDKKKGYFGKLDAGGGTDGYFQNQGMINAFKAKRQLSVFGIMSNTDKVGLGWQDNDKFGSGNGVTEITEDGGISTTYTSNDEFDGWDGKYNGQGFPKVWTGGAHYADKWGDEGQQHLTANYRYAMQNVEINGNTLTQYSLPGDSLQINNTTKTQFSKGDRHGADASYEWKIDSSSSLKLTANGGTKHTETYSSFNTLTYKTAGDVATGAVGQNNRVVTSNADAEFLNADLLYRKKFKKKGRTLSVDMKENYKDSKSTGDLSSVTLVDTANAGFVLPVKQKKDMNTRTLAFSGKATYTEPLSKVAFAEVDYGVTVNNSTFVNKSYDTLAGGQYSDAPNRRYSSDYAYNVLTNAGGLNLKFVYSKVNFSFGSDVSNAHFLQKDRFNGDTSHTYNYVNLFPQASFTYKISKQTSLHLDYKGSTEQPSIDQITPLAQNTDPLNIKVGNPNLKQEFVNTITARFNDFKVLSGRYIWVWMSYNNMQDAISTSQTILNGISSTQYVNVSGNYSATTYGGYGIRLKKMDMNAGISANTAINHVTNFINGQRNETNYDSYTSGLYFNYEKEKLLSVNFEPEVTYNQNTATISTSQTSYWTFNGTLSGILQLPLKFEIGSLLNVMIREKTEVFTTNNDVVKWNAWVGKKFRKKSDIELRASVFDILNQNIGFSRNSQGNIITQESYNTIRRYGLLSFIWNFSHNPASAAQPQQDANIIIKN